jgi:hypothetical protein
MTDQKPTKVTPAPTPTVPDEQRAPWAYKEEPDIAPAEDPTGAGSAPASTPGRLGPWRYQEGAHGQPMPWDYKEDPDVEGGAS